MDKEIYRLANKFAMEYIEEKRKNSKGNLYATWTQHVGTASNVTDAFNRRLKELGVSGGAQAPYLKQFMEENGMGDNYYE